MSTRTGRPEAWRSLAQRGIDTAADWSDMVAEKLHAAADPRAKLLRKRRWALRLGVFFTLSTVLWVGVTALLASWSTPVWALLPTDQTLEKGSPPVIAVSRINTAVAPEPEMKSIPLVDSLGIGSVKTP